MVIVAFEAAQLLDIAGPLQTFATTCETVAGRGTDADPRRRPYALAVVSQAGGPIRTTSGLVIETVPLAALARRPIDTIIVVGGRGVEPAAGDRRRLVRWLTHAAARARRVCSVCTGAFLLAETRLLAGRRATTHWEFCARLQALHPDIRVETDPIYVRDGRIWTSAGITAGIDLALALVEDDLGRSVALQVARHLVVFLKRPGGQAQFSEPLKAQAATVGPDRQFAALHAWIAENLARDLSVVRLAAEAGMSPRHFARLYAARQGTTPAKAVEILRVEAARRALEETPMPIKRVAATCGFGDEERMRRSFLRRLGLSPLDYRRRFAARSLEAAD